jgi:hypothetical protein
VFPSQDDCLPVTRSSLEVCLLETYSGNNENVLMNLVFDIEGNIVSLYVMVVESSTISQGKQKTFQASNLIVNEMKISKEL